MSWASSWLDRQGGIGKAINAIGGPLAKIVGNITDKIPVVGSIQDGLQAIGDYIPGGVSGPTVGGKPVSIADLLGQGVNAAGSFLGGNGGMNALGLAGGLQAAQLGQKSANYANMAAGNADRAYQQTAPLRVAGIAGMLHPQTADLSGLAATRMTGNPFAKPMSFGGPQGGAPQDSSPQGTQFTGQPAIDHMPASGTGFGSAGPAAAAQLQQLLLNRQGAPLQAQGMAQGGAPTRGPLT